MSNFIKKNIISELKYVYSENNTLSIIFQNNDLLLGVAGEFNNNLKELVWDGKSMTEAFAAVKFSSSSKVLELWRKVFYYAQKDNILFELYSSDLVGHLYKLYVPGLDYQCSQY